MVIFPPLLRKRTFAPSEPNTRTDTVVYTAIITVLCTASTLGVLLWYPGSKGALLVITLLVTTEVGHQDTVKRTARRVAGNCGRSRDRSGDSRADQHRRSDGDGDFRSGAGPGAATSAAVEHATSDASIKLTAAMPRAARDHRAMSSSPVARRQG